MIDNSFVGSFLLIHQFVMTGAKNEICPLLVDNTCLNIILNNIEISVGQENNPFWSWNVLRVFHLFWFGRIALFHTNVHHIKSLRTIQSRGLLKEMGKKITISSHSQYIQTNIWSEKLAVTLQYWFLCPRRVFFLSFFLFI